MENSKKKKNLITAVIMTALILTALVLFFTLPLSKVSSNGFVFTKMENGTYRVKSYTGNASYVEVPETVRGIKVTEIAPRAFQNQNRIKTLVVRSSVEKIGGAAFIGCTSIESLTVPFIGGSNDHNPHLDYVFSGNTGLNLNATLVPRSLKKVYVTKGCTKISTSAFYMCENLTEVHIPSTVTRIEDGSNYISVGVNGNTPSSNDYYRPFYGCSMNLKIYCASSKKPEEWGEHWNDTVTSGKALVFWSSKEY